MNVQVIIVAFDPEIEKLRRLCQTLHQSGAQTIIVDNSSENTLQSIQNEDVTIVPLLENKGIAHAQNVGIDEAFKRNADIIVFFDQDSEIDEQFLPTLIKPIIVENPMIVAPISIDLRTEKEYPSFKFNKLRLLKEVYGKNQLQPFPVDIVIASGTAATKDVFNIAGKMDEDFFIDFVDIEWSIRCRKHQIPIYINPQAVMKHAIGIENVNLGIIKTTIHSPARTYYKVRNPFLFLRKRNVPNLLGIKEILAALAHQFFQLFYVKDKKTYIKTYFSAIYDGIIGVKGKKNL